MTSTAAPLVVARAPMRVSLVGGGTDIASYPSRRGGLVISAAIDRYVALTLHPREFSHGVRVLDPPEEAYCAAELHNKFVAAALHRTGRSSNIQISALSDAPGGTGLDGSGAFTAALTQALRLQRDQSVEPAELAEEASAIEIQDLNRPVGKHDHYMAALGGLQALHIGRDGSVRSEPLAASTAIRSFVRDNLLPFFTGRVRDAGQVLAHQAFRTDNDSADVVAALDGIHALAEDLVGDLRKGRVDAIGDVLAKHWRLKMRLSSAVANTRVHELHNAAINAGATGGKLLGAGGGGFLLFAVPTGKRQAVEQSMADRGARQLTFELAPNGSSALPLAL